MAEEKKSNPFTIGNTAQERGFSYVPDQYVIPSSSRPSLDPEVANVPVIDIGKLREEGVQRANAIQEIGNACRDVGFFQIVNHGISQSVLDGALSVASDFFKLPTSEKAKFMSSDVCKPVRYATSIKDGIDKFQYWRVFLKHYANPLAEWIDLWPKNPPEYREKMGTYSAEIKNLSLNIMGAVTESLGLGPKYLRNKIGDGMQVMAVNCYPPCPRPEMTLGLPPHSDYSCLTIILQSSPGLEILDKRDGNWRLVPKLNGALQVHVGDHFEVLSNGIYKSVVHRAVLNSEKTRISIASLHSLGMDEKMGTAKELQDDNLPKKYRESSFRDFLNFISKNDLGEGKSFLDTLKIKY
ncbi:hypothetical protein Tsubulata_039976 [Turnera subulata]|uniref:Fe2OG dioxygenase domain-containing protein n=1 Tax=Turnera subulata TaxID=218843 RepID=A0A9Q0GAK6_9ROSI|nr:hypothetical protein Tsubulata_039976 [Turnera subulata]